jgi:hypothetical protein
MVATSSGRVHGLYYPTAPKRGVLDDDLQDNITLPLLGVTPTGHHVQESTFTGRPDPAATRGVTNPPLVTAWALHDAAVQAGSGPPFSRVDVVWVLAGDKDYDQTLPAARIKYDLGDSALEYFNAVQALFVVSSDDTYPALPAARGRVRVHHVRNVRTTLDAPRMEVLDGAARAQLDFNPRWRKLPPVIGEALRGWSVFQSLDDLPAVHWKSAITPPGYRLQPGSYRWEGGEVASGMNIAGGMTEDLRSTVMRHLGVRSAINENLIADGLAIPEPEAVAPYLQQLWFPIASPVHAEARVIVTVRPFEWWVYLFIVAAGCSLAGWIAMYSRKRELYANAEWPKAIDFRLGRPEDVVTIPVRLALQDRSGFPRRKTRLEVDLSIGRSVPGLPLLDGAALYSVTPRHLSLTLAGRSGSTEPVNVQVSGRAVDLKQLRGGARVHAAVTLNVTATDAMGIYSKVAFESPYVFDVTIGATDPDFERIVSAGAISPIYEKGLFHVPAAVRQQLAVGWVRFANHAAEGFVARDVIGRITKVKAMRTVAGSARVPLDARLVPAGDFDGENVRLRNGDQAMFDVYLDVPPDAFPADAPFCEVTIDVSAELRLADDAAARPRAVKSAIRFNWFPFLPSRHVCLDLGTSSVRMLRDGGAQDPDRWGYVLFDRPPLREPPLNERWPAEDLPSFARFEKDGRVLLGQDALRGDQMSPNFRLSVKDVMIDDLSGRENEIRGYVKAFFAKYYAPLTGRDTVVLDPYSETEQAIVAGDAEVLVASIPNDCSTPYREAYEEALYATKRFRHVSILREAEAVSIWYASWSREQRISAARRNASAVSKKRGRSEVLIVDVGAGTTDTALAEIIEPGGLQSPSVRIRSIGAASLAGRFVDRVILEELVQRGWVDRDALKQLPEREQLEIAEGVKIAIAERQAFYRRPPKDLLLRVDLDAEQLQTVEGSDAYRTAIAEIAEASLSVLLGRLPADVKLDQPRALLLTGRGVRMHGLQQAIVQYLGKHGLGNVDLIDIPERLLKAVVTIGCRAYATNYWSELKKASDASMDRLLLVYRGEDEVRSVEMLPAGAPISVPGPWIPMPSWSDAKLIATHLRRDEVLKDPGVRLSERKILEILDGRLQSPRRQWHAPYSLIRGPKDLPRSDDHRRVEVRVIPRPGGVELEHRTI